MDNTTLFRTSGQDRSFDASLAVLYARVSSREQAKEGFSIPAQLKLLREYAAQQGLSVLKQYVDVETAKQTGRVEFGKMVAFLETHPRVRTILVEKTDRLYRNFKDFVVLEDLEVHTHMVKEGVVLSPDSRSSEKLIHGIKVVMAKNHIDNLSEETRKGMLEKAEQGVYPSAAPLGYRNVESSEGKRVIAPDPDVAPMVMQLYEWYAAGGLALRDLSRKARQAGFAHRKSGHMVPTGTIHKILRSRLYMGEFVWKGKIYKGKHQPLVSRELWDRVQDMLDSRRASKHRQVKHDFAFSGLITCGHCGCALVGEIKKQRYVYYRCSHYKGKCDEPYVREEVLEKKFAAYLRHISFDEEVLDWVRETLQDSHREERQEHEAAIKRLQAEYERLQQRIEAAYIDKVDGRIDTPFFDKMSSEWRREQDRCLSDIQDHQTADQAYMKCGISLLDMAQDAPRLFKQQNAREKRRLLNFLLSNCSWRDGELTASFRQPFDFIAETTAAEEKEKTAEKVTSGLSDTWLRR